MKISQVLTDNRDTSQPGIHPEIIVTLDANIGLVCEADRASVTALSWIEIPDKGVSFFLDSLLISLLIHLLSPFSYTASQGLHTYGAPRVPILHGQAISPSDLQLQNSLLDPPPSTLLLASNISIDWTY